MESVPERTINTENGKEYGVKIMKDIIHTFCFDVV